MALVPRRLEVQRGLSAPHLLRNQLCGVFLLEKKRFSFKIGPDDSDGSVTAVFVTFNVVDLDGDVTLPGAFGIQKVRLSAWGHNWKVPAIGRGETSEEADSAIFSGRFFLTTTMGRDTYEAVKGLQELQEWSYGYDIDEYLLRQPRNGEVSRRYDGMIRVLIKMKVIEVSPVMIGSGINTETRSMKGCPNCGATHESEEPEIHVAASLSDGSRSMAGKDSGPDTVIPSEAPKELPDEDTTQGKADTIVVPQSAAAPGGQDNQQDPTTEPNTKTGTSEEQAPVDADPEIVSEKETVSQEAVEEVDPEGFKLFMDFQRRLAVIHGAVKE